MPTYYVTAVLVVPAASAQEAVDKVAALSLPLDYKGDPVLEVFEELEDAPDVDMRKVGYDEWELAEPPCAAEADA